MKQFTRFLAKGGVGALAGTFFLAAAGAAGAAETGHNPADTAWVLTSSALVLLMTPGLGLFYGGMVRRKNVLATLMQSFIMLALIGVQWVAWGYSLAFSPNNAFWGGLSWLFLEGVTDANSPVSNIPHYAFMIFQAMFAMITVALITGAFAERVRFKGFLFFSLLWATFVYDPVAHWVWGGGYFGGLGALDFAGGTVVHMTSGYSALMLALLIGRRKGYGKEPMPPHNMTMVITGTALLWFGWFGFNAGSSLAADALAAQAFVTTHAAAAMATLAWCAIEALHKGKITALGAASGAVAGLVAITPCAGFVDVVGALWIGGIVSVLSYAFILLKLKLGYDDSLDVFAVHGVGGTWGALAVGLWANPAVNNASGAFYGNAAQFGIQLKTVLATAAYSLLATAVIYFVVEKLAGMRVSTKEEELGLDLSQHGEEAYLTR